MTICEMGMMVVREWIRCLLCGYGKAGKGGDVRIERGDGGWFCSWESTCGCGG